jgi:serine/threonine protein kinase
VFLLQSHSLLQLQAEIKIHRTLKHKNVCEYKHFFEDRQNCYILLELCHNQSMNEMIKRRKRLTEPEARFFMKQLLEAVMYLHDQLVIHRDLKLGNLFLDRNLNIKVGDLGLATKLESVDEKRKTICGTPNYIAPEVIQGDRATRGHSFEVDVWSMGVIMFTCLMGKPPYEAKDVKATYQRILANEYKFPTDIPISNDAKDLIFCMLQSLPSDRPTLKEIAYHPFFTANHTPAALPSNATHVAPETNVMDSTRSFGSGHSSMKCAPRPAFPKSTSQRRPFGARDVNVHAHKGNDLAENLIPQVSVAAELKPKISVSSPLIDVQGAVKNAWCGVANAGTATTPAPHSTKSSGFQIFDELGLRSAKQQQDLISRTCKLDIQSPRDQPVTLSNTAESDAFTLNNMVDRISAVLDVVSGRSYSSARPDSPSLTALTCGGPTKWVSRYVDYTSKYGLGYLLNDGRCGRQWMGAIYFGEAL